MSSGSADVVVGNSGTAGGLMGADVGLSPSTVTRGTAAGGVVGVVVFFLNKCGGAVFLERLVVVVVVVVLEVVAVLVVVGMISGVSEGIEGSS